MKDGKKPGCTPVAASLRNSVLEIRLSRAAMILDSIWIAKIAKGESRGEFSPIGDRPGVSDGRFVVNGF